MTCQRRFCTYPKGPCDLDVEFAGCHDAEDFYDAGQMDRCQQVQEDEADLA